MPTIKPIINLKPTNPTIEDFLKIQSFGLQPYDRSPNDYLRFVAKIFTAWRDPNDNILNYDPFDDKYGVSTGTSTTLQATADKSIIAYVDGFDTSYNFIRLVYDDKSVDLTSQDTGNSAKVNLITYTTETGEIITIDKAKFGEYHRFSIEPGICFIDNQLIEIKEKTDWWFRVPEIKDYTNGLPNYELGQFIVDPLNVYSLLCNKNYKIILSYEYINQFESNSARLRFVTDETAVDEPYFLIASFSTDEYGIVHQTLPINEKSVEKYKEYIVKENLSNSGVTENFYYLRDINPQYLDKKYMANHKNLFKHLKSQILTELSNSKLSNVYHCKEITEEIDPSVSSGDFVFFDGHQRKYFPAEVSRQDFDKVHGLYLRNVSEGTDFLFTSGIVEISDEYSIINSENQVLRNLIPGAEYFLADDTGTALDTAPFIDKFIITDSRETGYFTISTEVIAKASSITIEFKNSPDSNLLSFSLIKNFVIDPKLGEQRIPQEIFWEFSPSEIAKVPKLKSDNSSLVQTEKIMFNITLDMVESEVSETNKEIIEDFKIHDTGDITITVTENIGTPEEKQTDVLIEESNIYIKTNGLPNVLLAKGPSGSPIMKLFDALQTTAKKDYSKDFKTGDRFQNTFGITYKFEDIKTQLQNIIDDLKLKIYNSSYQNLGLNDTMALLGNEVTLIDEAVIHLNQAIDVLKEDYKNAKLLFQSTESDLQLAITNARDKYLLSKNIYDHLYSQHEETVQKRNAISVKLAEINKTISDLEFAKSSAESISVSLNNLIIRAQTDIDLIQEEIDTLNNNITILTSNILTLLGNLKTYLDLAETQQQDSFNYKASYYGIDTTLVAEDFTDIYEALPRTLKVGYNIYKYYSEVDAAKTLMVGAEKTYKDSLEDFNLKVINGSINYATQLLLNETVNANKLDYETKLANYQYLVNKLKDFKDVKSKLFDAYIKGKTLVRGELFATFTANNDINSTWGDSDLYTFTMKISEPFEHDTRFEFIYKEDTQDVLNIIIPAGQTESSASVNIQMFPDTNIDAGIPKWKAFNVNTEIEIFNINKFNQMLIDNVVHIVGVNNSDTRDVPNLFTIDSERFKNNPVTTKKPTQILSLRTIPELNTLFETAQHIIDSIDLRENAIVDLNLTTSQLLEKNNLLTYNINIKNGLQAQHDLGIDTIDVYDARIASMNAVHDYYYYTTDKLTDVVGSDISYIVASDLINRLGSTITTVEATLQVDKTAYEKTLNDLKVATDKALGDYVAGIAETNTLIDIKEKEKARIQVMFNLYEERTKLVIKIYDNLNTLINSGIFNGEWVSTDTFLLNRFEYQDALESLLIDIYEDVILIPSASVIVPSILEYSVGVNGLQYPMDLQPWLFVKTLGKISTRNYPGATSIGFALNERTLILNIQHRPRGDISEFLNVYGNENDFNDQLMSKFRTSGNIQIKANTLSAINNLNSKISNLNVLLTKNQTSKTRTVNGKTVTIITSLNDTEMTTIDNLIVALVSAGGTVSEQQQAIDKKEFILRLIYSKFFGKGTYLNPFDYLFGFESSTSSWYATPGNINLNAGKDPFNPEVNNETLTNTYIKYVNDLYIKINGSSLSESVLKELFFNKISLYKDLDIINYILTILPQPLIDYQAKYLNLNAQFKNYIQDSITIARYLVQDDPENPMDDFENPAITDEFINSDTEVLARNAKFSNLIATLTASKSTISSNIDSIRINHDEVTKRISKYNIIKSFLTSLRENIKVAIDLFETTLYNYNGLKTEFTNNVKALDKEYLSYNSKMNKLPNVMWDIFRITNYQRTQWNYTYLVLRILGIQQEITNVVSGNSIQYSPINSKLSELKILRNKALTDNDEAGAYAYEVQIKALEDQKTSFTNMLKNLVNELNVIQLAHNKPTITSDTPLKSSYIIEELYIQDPSKYNLSYAFSPYPAYKEII